MTSAEYSQYDDTINSILQGNYGTGKISLDITTQSTSPEIVNHIVQRMQVLGCSVTTKKLANNRIKYSLSGQFYGVIRTLEYLNGMQGVFEILKKEEKEIQQEKPSKKDDNYNKLPSLEDIIKGR